MTILQALQNAEYNLVHSHRPDACFDVGKSQLHNAIALLDRGYRIHDHLEPLLEGGQEREIRGLREEIKTLKSDLCEALKENIHLRKELDVYHGK